MGTGLLWHDEEYHVAAQAERELETEARSR